MQPPWHFRLAKDLIRRGVRGPGLWLRLAHRLGLLNCVATYRLEHEVDVDVPLSRWENLWDASEVRAYEASLFDALAPRLIASAGDRPTTLIDCGADIGLFPVLLASRRVRFGRVIAFEPNPQPLAVLQTNVSRLGAANEVHAQAVADFTGRGRLVSPDYDPSAHACHLVQEDSGPIEVTTLDALNLPPGDLVLKVDVEGGELAVIRGGMATLKRSLRLTVILEAHPQVARRTGIDPLEAVRQIAGLRQIAVTVAEHPAQPVQLAQPFFQQFPQVTANLIVTSVL